MIRKLIAASAAFLLLLGGASCGSKLGTLSAEDFTVTPQPVEESGGSVPFTINGRFPEKFMKRNATVVVTPVLRYAGGETAAVNGATFQGENVQGNHQEISYRLGGSFTMRSRIAEYSPEMLRSDLYLTFKATVGKKEVAVPDLRVGYGVLSTATLLENALAAEGCAWSEDRFQFAIAQKQQAQIKYLIQQTNIRTSELQTTSVQDFLKTLHDIKADQKAYQLDNIEISSFASPEGNVRLNTELAQGRGKSSSTFVESELKSLGLEAGIASRYTAEDWEGFRELLEQSNIQDRDVILRVLSMYPDPEERERQIRNLSAAFTELADEVLPELRRSRLAINYVVFGRTDEEIQEQYKTDAAQLSADELLYAATLTDSNVEREGVYVTAATLYPQDYRAYNNLAALAYQNGDLELARRYAEEAVEKSPDAAEANANLALLTMAAGRSGSNFEEEVQGYLSKATGAKNYISVLGCYNMMCGQYATAAKNLKGTKTNAAALAAILNKDYLTAAEALAGSVRQDATTNYLRAIVAARTGQTEFVVPNLKAAIELEPAFRQRAAHDLEFAKQAADPAFQQLLR